MKKKYVLYLALLCLFWTTFPLVQGWLSNGDFLPRFAFIFAVIVLYPKLFLSRDFLFLVFYFLYIFLTDFNYTLVDLVAMIMEFTLPLVIANYLIDNGNKRQIKMLALFVIFITIVIMVNTISVDSVEPGIVRNMVRISSDGDSLMSQLYKRVGVCDYDFAQTAMLLGPVFLYMAKETKRWIIYCCCFIISVYFVFITGITTCLMILALMVTLTAISFRFPKVKNLLPVTLVFLLLLYFFGFIVIEMVLPYLEDTKYYSRLGGLLEFYGKDTAIKADSDVEARSDLYKLSLDVFLSNPLFGDATKQTGGHNYFLDRFARMGIIGTMPLFLFLFFRFKMMMRYIPSKSQIIYGICITGFFIIGFLKNLAGIAYWNYLFVYIPCLLKYVEISETYVRRKITT